MEQETVEKANLIQQKSNERIESKQKLINEYSPVHTGPYIVVVQGKQGNIGNLHPLKLGKILYEKGQYNIDNIKQTGKKQTRN